MPAKKPLFQIDNLHVNVEAREIVKGLNLEVDRGEVHAIMGPNASGKSTLANAIMGHPHYQVTEGQVLFKGEDITRSRPRRNARDAGSSSPSSTRARFPASPMVNFLRSALRAVRGSRRAGARVPGDAARDDGRC